MGPFISVEEVMSAVAKLRDELNASGEPEASDELAAALQAFYTTTTEALGELHDALKKTEAVWSRSLSDGCRALGQHTLKEALRLMNLR